MNSDFPPARLMPPWSGWGWQTCPCHRNAKRRRGDSLWSIALQLLTAIRSLDRLGIALFAVVTAACHGETIVTDTITQAGVTITAQPTAEDGRLAAAFGWPSGGVPAATVIIEQATSDSTPPAWADTLVADSAGRVTLEELQPGRYRVWVRRVLDDAEKTRAGAALGDTYGFAGVGLLQATASASTELTVTVHRLGRGSLVFSEIYPGVPLLPHDYYYFGQYVELSNNADTSIDLAGKLFLEAIPGYYDFPTRGCHQWDQIIDDPRGLWSRFIYRFPDASPTLQPGDAVVIATDAIDHRQVGTGPMFYDLSRAEFEFRGSADVDNPLALDMVSIGPKDGGLPEEHGWSATTSRTVIALATRVDMDSLPQMKDSIWGTVVRVPASALVDVVQFNYDVAHAYPECPSSVDPSIDSDEAMVLSNPYLDPRSMHRRIGGVLPSGRVFLQKSHDSAIDFEAGPGNPGTVP